MPHQIWDQNLNIFTAVSLDHCFAFLYIFCSIDLSWQLAFCFLMHIFYWLYLSISNILTNLILYWIQFINIAFYKTIKTCNKFVRNIFANVLSTCLTDTYKKNEAHKLQTWISRSRVRRYETIWRHSLG